MMACAPPPAVAVPGGEPSITLVYPPADAGELPLDADGVLSFLVVVDMNGITFIEPGTKEEDAAGEGHWHVYVNDEYLGFPPHLYWTYRSEPDEFEPGDAVSVRVTLATNDHIDLDAFADWEDVNEYTVSAAP
jgi:hypothetical protein